MPAQPDPYRTLGLPRTASTVEVKAAYRRLAKVFHPDTAGEKAIPRFLAIQAAYDAITGATGSARQPRAPGRPPTRAEPWRADPERARGSGGGSTSPGAGSKAGRRTGDSGDRRGTGPGGAAGAAPAAGRGRQSTRPSGEPSSTGRRGAATGRSRRDRSTNRATPGSTTYDAAEHEPFDPEWSGASWYGTTSGTYWTINPKEYADPRKHGPEYQARARRAWPRSGDEASASEGESSATGFGSTEPGATEPAATEPRATEPAATEPRATEATTSTDLAPDDSEPRAAASARSTARTGGFSAGGRHGAPGAAAAEHSRWSLGDLREPIGGLRVSSGPPARAILALLGWPPLGFALAAFISERSGCGRFAASCVDTFDVGIWLGQLAIIALLLAIPRLAFISAVGTLAMLTVSVPGAILLSAAGGSNERDAAANVLTGLLVLAYLGGVLFAVARGTRTMRA